MTPKIPQVGDLFYWRDQRVPIRDGISGKKPEPVKDELWDCVWLMLNVEKSYDQKYAFGNDVEFVWVFRILLIKDTLNQSRLIPHMVWDDDSVQHAYILIQSA